MLVQTRSAIFLDGPRRAFPSELGLPKEGKNIMEGPGESVPGPQNDKTNAGMKVGTWVFSKEIRHPISLATENQTESKGCPWLSALLEGTSCPRDRIDWPACHAKRRANRRPDKLTRSVPEKTMAPDSPIGRAHETLSLYLSLACYQLGLGSRHEARRDDLSREVGARG